jgi:hypothetical protein
VVAGDKSTSPDGQKEDPVNCEEAQKSKSYVGCDCHRLRRQHELPVPGRTQPEADREAATIAEVSAPRASFMSKHERLDLLANNAGALFRTRQLSADGFEMTFALNGLTSHGRAT